MTEHLESVEQQRERLEEEKADRTVVLHYFQKGAGTHYRLTRYKSGREKVETFEPVYLSDSNGQN